MAVPQWRQVARETATSLTCVKGKAVAAPSSVWRLTSQPSPVFPPPQLAHTCLSFSTQELSRLLNGGDVPTSSEAEDLSLSDNVLSDLLQSSHDGPSLGLSTGGALELTPSAAN